MASSIMISTAVQCGVCQRRNGRIAQGGERRRKLLKDGFGDVHLEADFFAGVEGADEEQFEVFELLALVGIGVNGLD